MRFLYDNLFITSTGTTKTASSEASGYPVTALDDYLVATLWRSTGDTDEWVKIDFGSAVTITDVAIFGHNFTNGATVKVQGNATDAWGGPSVDETITWRADVMEKNFTGGSYRWWRIQIADSANPDTFVEFGYNFLGANLTLGDIISKEWSLESLENSIINETRSGQVYGDIGVIRRLWIFDMPHLSIAEKANMDTMFALIGKHTPFVFMIDEDDTVNNPPAFGRFSENFSYNHIFNNLHNLSFAIVEVF